MFRSILHTLGSRFIVGLLNLVLLVVTTRMMGAEVKGAISLLVLSISVSTLVSGLAGGPALVYMTPRHRLLPIYMLNIGWSIVATFAITIILHFSGLLGDLNPFAFYALALCESFFAINLMVLLGKEKIARHNLLQVLKVGVCIGLLIPLILYKGKSIDEFALAFGGSLLITLLLSQTAILSFFGIDINEENSIQAIFKSIRLGSIVQVGNIAQILNYRASYYLLEWLISPPELALIRIGIYSAAIQISEALWQFTRSINTVQYSKISNSDDRKESLKITMRLTRLNYFVTGIGILILALTPANWYSIILGTEFNEVKQHFLLLSPGIFALAFSGSISQFFSGLGEYKYNTITSILSLALTIPMGYASILWAQSLGAAVATSAVYCFQAVLLLVFLKRKDHVSFHSFLLQRHDFVVIRNKIIGLWDRSF